jgi:hypothetical protein
MAVHRLCSGQPSGASDSTAYPGCKDLAAALRDTARPLAVARRDEIGSAAHRICWSRWPPRG